MIRAGIYARKSTLDERDENDGKSTARQVAQAREFAASKGWVVADEHVYVDEGISGTIFDMTKRKGLGRLLTACKAKAFDVIVTMEQSRLGRDIAKTLELVAEIEAAGLEVWSYSDARRISVEEELDEMNATLKGIVDKAESRRASIRTSAGLAAKAQKGHVTGTVPFGSHACLRAITPSTASTRLRRMSSAASSLWRSRATVGGGSPTRGAVRSRL